MARPTVLTEDVLDKIDRFLEAGASQKKIASLLGLSPDTVTKARRIIDRRAIAATYPLPNDHETRSTIAKHLKNGHVAPLKQMYPHHPERAFELWYEALFPHPDPAAQRRQWAATAFAHGKSTDWIANACGVTQQTIRNWLRKEGIIIPTSYRGPKTKRPTAVLLERHYGKIRDYLNIYRNQGISHYHTLAKQISTHFPFDIPPTAIRLIMYRQDIEQGTLSKNKLHRAAAIAKRIYTNGQKPTDAAAALALSPSSIYTLLMIHCARIAFLYHENVLHLWRTRNLSYSKLADLHNTTPIQFDPEKPTNAT